MNDVLAASVLVTQKLHSLGKPFCIIGGVALQRWGEPRMTVDVDATVLTGFGNETEAVESLLTVFLPRIADITAFARQSRVALLQTQDGIGVDVSLGAFPFEERAIQRSSDWEIAAYGTIRTCGAEDLVVLKSFAARPQDWIDVEGIIIRQGNRLNQELIFEELTPLADLKEEPEILTRLQSVFVQHNG